MHEREKTIDQLCQARIIRAAAGLTGETERFMEAIWGVCLRANEGDRQLALISFLAGLQV